MNLSMKDLHKLQPGDRVAVLSPSFAAPGMFPEVYELGLRRLREVFQLEPVEFPTTRKLGSPAKERARDLIAAFEDPEIAGILASIGGDDQVTYIKNLPAEPFVKNPKPFFGYSDNSHFMNFLWLNGVPSFYGGSVMTQMAMQTEMDAFTVEYLKRAFFNSGEIELTSASTFTDEDLDWGDVGNLKKRRTYEANEGWFWSGSKNGEGVTWGGCLESIDEMLRHGIRIPTLEDFEDVILMTETSEELPSVDYVRRIYRALGEQGILEKIQGMLVGRPKARSLDAPHDREARTRYREEQRDMISKTIAIYNSQIPVVQNMDFGHTDPQIPMPYGRRCKIEAKSEKVSVDF